MNGVNFYSEQRKFYDKQNNEVLSNTGLSAQNIFALPLVAGFSMTWLIEAYAMHKKVIYMNFCGNN